MKRHPKILSDERLRALLVDMFVNKVRIAELAQRYGMAESTVKKIKAGGTYSESRARILKELRAEGHTIEI